MSVVGGAECFVCTSATGQTLHLWLKALDNGNMWTWLEESPLEPGIVTPVQAVQTLTVWRKLRDHIKRGENIDQQFAVIFTGEQSQEKTVLVFGLDNGHMTYWRNGETLDPVPLDLNAVEELISTWEAVARVASEPDRTAC